MDMEPVNAELVLLEDRDAYDLVILKAVRGAKRSILIATANLRNIKVPSGKRARRAPSLIRLLWRKVQDGVEVRVLHSAKPTRSWLEDEAALNDLNEPGVMRRRCTRSHFKAVVVDGVMCYIGSANITGAGLGAKSEKRRNFELGIWTGEPALVRAVTRKFDDLWCGRHCAECDRPESCETPVSDLP